MFMTALLIGLAGVSTGKADQPTTLVVTKTVAPPPSDSDLAKNVVLAPAQPWADSGTQQFGPEYRSYVPVEIKSDTPEVGRTWDAAGHPGNGSHMTPEGMACATDADCQGVMGCFNRADSGQTPVMLCAIPAGH